MGSKRVKLSALSIPKWIKWYHRKQKLKQPLPHEFDDVLNVIISSCYMASLF